MSLTFKWKSLPFLNARELIKPTLWSKADLHLHTTYSDGYMTPAETIEIIARDASVTLIAVTDHDTTEGAFLACDYARRHHPWLEVIIGQEVTTGEGDVVGLFLQRTLPRFDTAAVAIRAIHQQGGLAIAVHPFVVWCEMESVGRAILRLPFDAVEVRHGCPLSIPANLLTGLVNRFGQRLPALGNSDSHLPFSTGQAFTWFPGTTRADLRRAIETNTVKPGGTTWKVRSLLRKLIYFYQQRQGADYAGDPELQRFKELASD
jgi:hypothetical protein